MFDPFTASLAEAQAHPDQGGRGGALHRFAAAQGLTTNRVFYEANPLDGIAVCARSDLVAPEWLARAFLRGFDAVLNCRAQSWDEAFGAPYPPNSNISAMRRRRIGIYRVAQVVQEFVTRFPGESVEALFAAASATGTNRADGEMGEYARRLGVGKTEAERLYRLAVASGIAQPVSTIRRELGWPARPALAKSRKPAGVRKRL